MGVQHCMVVVLLLRMCAHCARERPSRAHHTSSSSAGAVGKTSALSWSNTSVQSASDRPEKRRYYQTDGRRICVHMVFLWGGGKTKAEVIERVKILLETWLIFLYFFFFFVPLSFPSTNELLWLVQHAAITTAAQVSSISMCYLWSPFALNEILLMDIMWFILHLCYTERSDALGLFAIKTRQSSHIEQYAFISAWM